MIDDIYFVDLETNKGSFHGHATKIEIGEENLWSLSFWENQVLEESIQFGNDTYSQLFNKYMSLFGTFTFVFLLVASWRLQVLAKKITLQIVRLFETLEQITQSGVQFVQLKFKKQSRELNKLSLNFNKVAKTIQIAYSALDEGDDTKAMLNYHEACGIFQDFKNL